MRKQPFANWICSVVKEPSSKKVPSQSDDLKIVHGLPVTSCPFDYSFLKWGVLYLRTETLNVSKYMYGQIIKFLHLIMK